MKKHTRFTSFPLISVLDLFSPEDRVWYKKKRNIFRIAIVLMCLVGMLVTFLKYTSGEREYLWISTAGYCGVLLVFSYIFTYVVSRMRLRKLGMTKMDSMFLIFLVLLSLFPLIMLGKVTADIAQGPIDRVVKIVDMWDPKRGGDRVSTSEGKEYEIASREVVIRVGHTYRIKVLEHSKLILEAEEQR
ncbi:hypothetical protein [Paenibacillus azoreducens]|uniref:Uncharacterized protein n=1 Tax=Paenibacillus azoreducens TaxID=116718 RepID=A0A920CUL4_9BACL|nr:hypothetical protein [Paenibacillus azoreducens]GIO50454.1 hypothetical protein J34TS1_52190 [Paenibacillus azoreducens]